MTPGRRFRKLEAAGSNGKGRETHMQRLPERSRQTASRRRVSFRFSLTLSQKERGDGD